METKDAEDAGADPMRTRLGSVVLDLGTRQGQVDVEVGMDVDGEDGNRASITGFPESEPGPKPEAPPEPDSPSLPVQLPSPHGSTEEHPDLEPPLGKICEPPQAPKVNRTQYDERT